MIEPLPSREPSSSRTDRKRHVSFQLVVSSLSLTSSTTHTIVTFLAIVDHGLTEEGQQVHRVQWMMYLAMMQHFVCPRLGKTCV